MNDPQKCEECSNPLPTHIADAIPKDMVLYRHTCTCGRKYKIVQKQFVAVGWSDNTFASFDRREVNE